MTRNRLRDGWVTIAGAWLLMSVGVWAAGDGDSPRAGSHVHRVAEGETLAAIAAQYLGGAETVPELLRFNNIDNPLSVQPGTMLGIPGPVRDAALQALTAGEAAILAALKLGAEEYARAELGTVRALMAAARVAWDETSYEKVSSLCAVLMAYADEAGRLAGERALQPLSVKITSVQGEAFMDPAGGTAWQPLREGDDVPVAGMLRVGSLARVQVTLPGGSRVQINADSTVRVSEMILDRRSGSLRMRLNVLMGEVLGDFEALPTDDSSMEIESGTPVTAIRGTVLRVNRMQEVSCVMLLEGEARTSTERWTVDVPGGMGIVSKQHKPKTERLPPAPALRWPDAGWQTATQVLQFAWAPVGERRLQGSWRTPLFWSRESATMRYHFELATDTDFNRIVAETNTADTTWSSAPLPPDTYYWRVASVLPNTLEGKPAEPREVQVTRRLNVVIDRSREPIITGDVEWVSPDDVFTVRPADADTSVVALELRRGDGPWTAATEARFANTGPQWIEARGRGADGTVGPVVRREVQADAAPPHVTFAVSAMSEAADGSGRGMTLTIAAEDDTQLSHVEVSKDGAAFEPYLKPLWLEARRGHEIAIRALDRVGNSSPVRALTLAPIQ